MKILNKNDIILHLCNWSLIDASASSLLQYVVLVNVYETNLALYKCVVGEDILIASLFNNKNNVGTLL